MIVFELRIILSIDIIFWFFRGLHGYSYIRSLGPKLVMIRRMIGQLAYFTLIAVIFIFSYGVSTQSLMYHNQEFNLGLIKNIFFPAYFVIGGEYYQRDDLMDSKILDFDKSNGSYITIGLES